MTLRGMAILMEHEGEVLHAYQDSELYWTIGIGHLIEKSRGGGIKQKFSRMIFEDDIADKTMDCRNAFPWFHNLDMVRQDVIVMLAFNMGVAGVAGFHKMIEAIRQQNWSQAAWELSNSKWKTQVGKERHDTLTEALESGCWKD